MEFKKYDHSKEEKIISDYWIKNNCFKPKKSKLNKQFSVVIPPPNVTGRLHMGHALNNSLQDVLVRFKRMSGFETLWQPGTDHAGIATQAVVEKNLEKENLNKNQLGRENFIKKVWEWKEESGGIILDQLKKLGCSCDWSRTRFTMDKDLSKAVNKVFVDLYNDKLIYKDKKLVNWDTKLQTAISDLEVIQKDVQSQLYYINYDIEGTTDKITIATTRPETMMGDTAIAVNPKDERYKSLIGKNVLIPLVNRTIKIIADYYADPEQGSGAVKITPAHDFNDYEVGKRNDLKIINILEKNGSVNKNGIKELIGLDRFEARKLLVKKLKEEGYLVKIENIKNKVPYGDRSNSIIEPLLTEQWFVDAKKLAEKPIKIVTLQGSGVINSSLYETMLDSGLNDQLTYYLSDVYAWTIDFFRLQKGDRFKVIYTEKFVDDSISLGVEEVIAAYFEHKGKGLYAFKFESERKKGIIDYFDENAKNLRRAFLKSPVKFSRISSRYNLKRRIALYGNKIRPHKGTDFAAAIGTPIMATANGTVTKSSYSKGNGNYVTIRHNNIYKTQYLHMKKRKVKRGQGVKQGDIIGWVGMTGNTSGPHVCYRFWKNGRQVDPFKQKLPEAKPISKDLKAKFARHIVPYKYKLDCIAFDEDQEAEIAENNPSNYAKDPS